MAAVPHNLRPQSPYYATLSEGLRRRARAGGGVQRGRARAELADAAEADGGVRGRRARVPLHGQGGGGPAQGRAHPGPLRRHARPPAGEYPFMAKGGEDLRKDEHIQALFAVMQGLLQVGPSLANSLANFTKPS